MTELDLTPFGFTPTESLVYGALLRRGPSGGYPIANDINVARANVYQALSGLVQKGAAVQVSSDPKEYRASSPDQLFAMIVDQESRKVDLLERQLTDSGREGDRSSVPVSSARALNRLVTQHSARGQAVVGMLAPSTLLRSLVPVWRKREAAGETTRLCPTDEGGEDLPVETLAVADPSKLSEYLGEVQPCVFYSTDAAFSGIIKDSGDPEGNWTGDVLQVAVIRAAFEQLVS